MAHIWTNKPHYKSDNGTRGSINGGKYIKR